MDGAGADLDPADVGFTLLTRARFAHRVVVLGMDRDELLTGSRTLARWTWTAGPGGQPRQSELVGRRARSNVVIGPAMQRNPFPFFSPRLAISTVFVAPSLRRSPS